MRHLFKKLLPSVTVALAVTGSSLPMPARAQTYRKRPVCLHCRA